MDFAYRILRFGLQALEILLISYVLMPCILLSHICFMINNYRGFNNPQKCALVAGAALSMVVLYPILSTACLIFGFGAAIKNVFFESETQFTIMGLKSLLVDAPSPSVKEFFSLYVNKYSKVYSVEEDHCLVSQEENPTAQKIADNEQDPNKSNTSKLMKDGTSESLLNMNRESRTV